MGVMRGWRRQLVIGACMVLATAGGAFSASDPTMTSTSYSATETELGGSGCTQVSGVYKCGTSTNYSLDPATDDGGSDLGATAVGNSASINYQTNSGFDTTAQPGLIMSVNTGSINFGPLSTVSKVVQTASFSVRDYTSYGYIVQVIGTPPTYSGHQLAPMTGNAGLGGDSSSAGTEQFGFNLVSDALIGGSSNPVCQAATFCSGVAGDGSTLKYTVDSRFRFSSGETVASGSQSSGETDYTMTFVANMSTLTPSGVYTGNLTLVATGSY